MATPIEIIGLVHIGITTACSTIATLKENADVFRSLVPLIHEADEKAQGLEDCIANLSELGGIRCLQASFFQRTLEDIQGVQDELSQVQKEFNQTRLVKRFVQASNISEKLGNVNATLGQLLRDLKLVGMFGEMLSMVVATSQEHICNAFNRTLTPRLDEQAALSILHDINQTKAHGFAQIGVRDPATELLADQDRSAVLFLTGKAYYEGEGPMRQNYKLAAQHLLAAYNHGTRDAAYYLGMMFYHGRGVEMNFKLAFDYLSAGVEIRHAESVAKIASCYWRGRGTEVDPKKALECTKQAAELGSPRALYNYAYDLLYGFEGVSQDLPKAVKFLQRSQLGGEPYAYIGLAKCYELGIVVERDPEKSFECWNAAYNCGVASALSGIARCYEEGFGVEQDLEQAAELYRKASLGTAEDPETYCKSFYGLCLVRGRGIGRNRHLGLKLIREGATDRVSNGWFVLGQCYRYGYGVRVDVAKAVSYYVKGAKCDIAMYGIRSCEMALAEMFEKGEGLACNLQEAARHYTNAANLLNPIAQWKMGLFHESGTAGIKMSTHRALDFFEKAARSGNTQAYRKAGLIYMKGIGVQQDRTKGKQMLREAVERGDDSSLRLLRSERIWRMFKFRLNGLKRRQSI